jgi:cell division transport system permease protein
MNRRRRSSAGDNGRLFLGKKIVIPGRLEATDPESAFVFFTREALRRVWRARRTSSVAVAMITIALFILGVFLLVAENMQRSVEVWEGTAKVSVYLKPEATDEGIAQVDAALAKNPMFIKRSFVSREKALERFRAHFSSLTSVVDQLDENPFPPSFEVDVTEATIDDARFNDGVRAIRSLSAVDDVQFDWQWIAKVKGIVRLLMLIGLIAGGILAVAAAFTTANVIRLSMILYREEISIMRLVGASERMIRGPFLLQGFLQGTIGGLVAVAMLFGAFVAGRAAVQSTPSVLWDFIFVTFLPWTKLAYVILGGMFAGLLGSWMSLSEFSGDELPTE